MKSKKIIALLMSLALISPLAVNQRVNAIPITDVIENHTESYKELPTKYDVSKYKNFEIRFNKEISFISVNSNTIKVVDSKGNEVPVKLTSKARDKRVVIVNAPTGGYTEGETYALIIKKGLSSLNNFKLVNETVMKFVVGEEITVPTKSEDEIYLDELYLKNSPYWNDGMKFIDGKLNLHFYDYATKKSSWETLSTTYNPKINNQIVDVFKALYTEKEGYTTEVSYGKMLHADGSGGASVSFCKNSVAFTSVNFYTSPNAQVGVKNAYASLIISKTSLDFNTHKYVIKNALVPIVGANKVDTVYNGIIAEYKKCVLDNPSDINSLKVYDKVLGDIKVSIYSYRGRFGVDFIKE